MRVLVDPESGELVEALQGDIVEEEPYDYGAFRRAAMAVSREHRAAIREAKERAEDVAAAEREYHLQLAIAVAQLKTEHGSTIAETLAKGEPRVAAAKEARDVAIARDRAAIERMRLCRDDRAALLTMGAWSRQVLDEG